MTSPAKHEKCGLIPRLPYSYTSSRLSALNNRGAMEDDSSSSSETLRSNWTHAMDEYFIELLLDQVQKGNRTSTSFSKQAWLEMIALFSDKYKCKHDIDVLKNRYKHLRKQYHNTKILVQNEFIWDDNRQMVTGNDEKWDDYIKAHPEMEPYRTKVVPYYNELRIIFGHTVADGRYSLSCFDIDFENEVKILEDNIPTKDDSKKIDWSETMEQHFIQLMLEQVQKGNKLNRTFKNKAWIHMITAFNTAFGFQYGKVVLKTRFNLLRRQYFAVKYLLSQDGFTWHERHQMIVAEDRVWKKVIKAQQYFRRYRNKSLSFYKDMSIICGNETPTFQYGYPFVKAGEFSVPIIQTTGKEGNLRNVEEILEDDEREEKKCRYDTDTKEPCEGPSEMNEETEIEIGMEDAMQEMVAAVTALTKKEKNTLLIEDVIYILQAMPDMDGDDDLLLDACDFLEDDNKAKVFLALDPGLRKKWLLRKLRPQ
nr:L10-interacting MYB domain-containing protein-like isoform X3 [Ipomoea batatas]